MNKELSNQPEVRFRWGVGLALYSWDKEKEVLYMLVKPDKVKQESAGVSLNGRGRSRLVTWVRDKEGGLTFNILTGGVKERKETPFRALLREIQEEGWREVLSYIDPAKLSRCRPVRFSVVQLRKGKWTDFVVELYPLSVPWEILCEVAQEGDFKMVAFTPDQLELGGGYGFGRPVLSAAAAAIIKMEKGRESE